MNEWRDDAINALICLRISQWSVGIYLLFAAAAQRYFL